MLTRQDWLTRCPDLHIESPDRTPVAIEPPSEAKWQMEKDRLDYDGHFKFERIFSAEKLQRLRHGAEQLTAQGLPALFVSLFDEFWETVQALRPVGERLLGEDYLIFPDYWVWHIDHRQSQSGWRPHRESVVNVADPNYPTESISLWVALSDATTENGCMYVLPKSKDKGYPHTIKFDIGTLQHVKALPVPAGSVIGWNQSVFHWGSSNSREAEAPRISFAMELRPLSQTREIPFMMKSDVFPNFEERIRLVAMQFVNYRHLHGLSEQIELQSFVDQVLGKDYVAS